MPAKKKAAVVAPPAADPAPTPAPAMPATPAPAAPPAPASLKIAPAKGRPLLHWVGKKPLRAVTAFPAQLVETFSAAPADGPLPDAHGRLYHGDNKEVLAHLLANGLRGQVNLVYIDPPFDSGADYVRKVSLRGKGGSTKLDGEAYGLGEQIQYTDIWANDSYLQFMYERLLLLKELMADGGNIVLHANTTKGHYLRCLMDEVFGSEAFRSEITWHYDKYQMGGTRQFVDNTDRLFWYSKGDGWVYNLQKEKLAEPKELLAKGWDKDKGVIVNLRDENGKTYKITVDSKKIDDFWELAHVGVPVFANSDQGLKVTLQELPVSNAWLIPYIAAPSHERTGYPTQKPEPLLSRVVSALSNPGDLVLDCFMGSGTTCAVAQKLGRRWIGADINKGALQTAAKRIQSIITEQAADAAQAAGQLLPDDSAPPPPAALAYAVHRVNDYDLQIQHNEAVALACEHLGVSRTKTDAYFEGTRGKQLVKIVPLNHPLSPADLEQLRDELKARPDEARDILLVCLGRELACEPWLTEWHRLRKRGDVPNKIEVVELRTDPKYGKFIAHQPASARVDVTREGAELHVTIKDFASPTILERLSAQAGVLKPQIPDWRAMVDSVMIDPVYDGQVFHVAHADIPEKKTDYVAGSYVLPAPAGGTTVAVKLTDMLGEELLLTFAL